MSLNELDDLVGRDDVLLLGYDPGCGDVAHVRIAIDPTLQDAFVPDWRDERFQAAGTLALIVGGERRCYAIFEDPSDGYRSCLGGTLLSSAPDDAIWFLESNPRPVHVRKQDWLPYEYNDNGRAEADVILFEDKELPTPGKQRTIDGDEDDVGGGHVWFIVGTDDSDSYYPSFVARWLPYEASETRPTNR